MKSFYGTIRVVEERILKVSLEAKKLPTKEQALKILRNNEYDDIMDEETIAYKEVLAVDLEEQDDE